MVCLNAQWGNCIRELDGKLELGLEIRAQARQKWYIPGDPGNISNAYASHQSNADIRCCTPSPRLETNIRDVYPGTSPELRRCSCDPYRTP